MSEARREASPKQPLHESEIAYNNARSEREHAEILKLGVETRGAEASARIVEIALGREEEKRAREKTANELHHVYVFDDAVGEASVKKCVAQLVAWSRLDPGCDIEIQINSPGGSIFDGFALIDFIRNLRDRGHKITMVTYGMAASMAGVLLQAADTRVMGANSLLLIHEGSLSAGGDFGKVEDRVKLMGLLHERILSLFVDRSEGKSSRAFIKRHWERKDWWLTADSALKHGFIDEVR